MAVTKHKEAADGEGIPAGVEIPPGCVAMFGGACSFGGMEYGPDDKGIVIVPEAAAAILECHGFKRVG